MSSSLDNMPQVSTAPDPSANMPTANVRYTNIAETFKSFDDFINGMIMDFGDKLAAGAMAAGGKVLDVAANTVNNVASSAAAPFKSDFTPSNSPGHAIEANGPSQQRARSQEVAPSNEMLGQLSPPTTPSVGKSQGQGMGIG